MRRRREHKPGDKSAEIVAGRSGTPRVHVEVMTKSDYHETMKTVRIAELKARLSEHLREVKRGNALVVMERDTPVARLIPYVSDGQRLKITGPMGRYPSLREVPLPDPLELAVDVVDVLLDQRQTDR
jgi:prevent-host-death family protein